MVQSNAHLHCKGLGTENNSNCGKVMFSEVSVNLITKGGWVGAR